MNSANFPEPPSSLARALALIVVLASALAFAVRAVHAQERIPPVAVPADTSAVMLGLLRITRPFPLQLREVPARVEYFLRQPFTSWVDEWQRATRARVEALYAELLAPSWSGARPSEAIPAEEIAIGRRPVVAARDTTDRVPGVLSGRIGDFADIGMRIGGRAELGGAWARFEPCDPSLHYTCNPSLFPQLKPDMKFGIQVAGTVSERIHVNVDYDQTREFDAANNLNVYYQGFADEILQRVEVGDVSIRLPASRYLTQGIPAGNFGFKATGQLGPLEFQTVWAQQRGDVSTREFHLGGLGNQQGLVQSQQLVLDDAAYLEGQFFFLVDPSVLAGAPHIDVLAMRPGDAPAALQPQSGGGIQVYRDERINLNNPQQQGQPGYFLADAVSGSVKVSGLFRRLIPNEQYTIHPSGLWIMLRSPLRADEQLAISYITETGDSIGTMNAESAPPGTTPQLQLLRGAVATHQPGSPTWAYEMHQVYRLDSSNGVEANSIELRVSLGDLSGGRTLKTVNGAPLSYLRLLGLDEDSPVDQLDPAQIYQPGRDAFGSGSSVGGSSGASGTFVIFPTLEPFARPGAVPSAGLNAADATAALGADANATIYDNADPIVRAGASRFRLNFTYRLKVDGMVEVFNLGAFGLREGSERLYLGEKQLQSGVDYTIDYDIGAVTLNDAQALLAANPGSEIRATFEQKSLFQIAPTSVFGLNARYGLGRRGELNFVGLYQAEKTIMSRPQLGVEPSSIMLGGASGRLDLGGFFLDRALGRIPGLRVGSPSSVTLTGELALSVPNPNTRDAAYLDDFEATDEFLLPTHRRRWSLGSRPETNEHATDVLPFTLDATTATGLVWQHDVLQNGNVVGGYLPRQIDNAIRVAGNQVPEPVLWLTFGDSTPNTLGRRWRSITTVLSTTGRDMTRSEYLEFYVRSGALPGQALVIDIGQLSEDAFFVDKDGLTGGTYDDGTRWGLGLLDQEANLANREVWGPDKDARGLWNRPCEANRQQQYALGDPNANCARNNGEPDNEDLDGNGILDGNDQAFFRFVIPIDATSDYLVRDTSATKTAFRLFRVPLRTGGRAVNGATDATWRFIKHMRMTVASSPVQFENFVLARMRIAGARWTKRDVNGIMQGMLGEQASVGGSADMLQVGPISQLHDPNYAPPAGVSEELQDPSSGFGGTGIEFNEKSLKLSFSRLQPGERAEIYFRYPQQSRGFLTYRQMRLWALARGGDWGQAGALRFQVRVGNDPRNFYLYQSRLNPPAAGAAVPTDWLPELAIEFDHWIELREQAEELLARGANTPGEPLVLWNADSTYAVVLEDRARAPNLAAMRELTFAVFNGGNTQSDGEVWIDDMRLTSAFKDPGMAGTVSLDVRGGDFMAATVSYASQSAVFRQLNQDARYLSAGDVSVASSAQLGQLAPSGWGLEMPLSVTHTRTVQKPTFLEGTDIRTERLNGLRDTGADATRVSLSVRKRTPSANPLLGVLVDGLALRFGYNQSENSSVTTRAEQSGINGDITYTRDVAPRTLAAVPGVLESALRVLAPTRVEESDFFKRLTGARLRWSPERLSFGTAYYKREQRSFQFNGVLQLPGDSTRPIESPRHGLENDARISFLPFQPLRATLALRSSRDLLATDRATGQRLERSAIETARAQLGSIDVGWETSRSMSTEVSFRPDITAWLRPMFNYSARFSTDRNPSYLEVNSVDSTAFMQRRFQADRQINRGLMFDPAVFVRTLYRLPQQTTDSTLAARSLTTRLSFKLAQAVRPIELSWNSTLGSQFERELLQPGFGYQIGFGNFDAYRLIGGDTAVFVNARNAFSVRSALRLPLSSELTASYEETTLDAIDQRGGNRQQLERRWPLHLIWNRLPLPGFIRSVVVNTSLTAGYERSRQSTLLGGLNDQARGGSDTRLPVSLTLGFANGFSARYLGTMSQGKSTDPTGNAEQAGSDHSITLSGLFQPPESWREKVQGPVTVNFTLREQSQRNCRFQSTFDPQQPAECIAFIDFKNRTLNMVMESSIRDLRVGFQASYSSRKSFVGTHNGNSQFQIGFFGNFEMKAGRDLQPNGLR